MSNVLFSIQNSVGKITLNRPDVLNSFNVSMAKELQTAVDAPRVALGWALGHFSTFNET